MTQSWEMASIESGIGISMYQQDEVRLRLIEFDGIC